MITTETRSAAAALAISPDHHERLARGEHHNPHSLLGAHPVGDDVVVRAYHPDAEGCELLIDGDQLGMESLGRGLFAAVIKGRRLPVAYELRFSFPDGSSWVRGDPYRFSPTVGDMDAYLFNEGTHRKLWRIMGAHSRTHEGVRGTSFCVWAPNAKRVGVVGEFNQWDGRLLPMRSLGASGLWELFIPGIGPGSLYKFEIKSQSGALRLKTDPYARCMQAPPETASIVTESKHDWSDGVWMERRSERDPRRLPMAIYEVHLGSWAHVEDSPKRSLSYREAAPRLVQHVKNLGFTHIELLPLAEHAFYPSWGYQVTGYFAPTSRYGSPDDLRYFVDYCHRHGVGVIIDWVPAHFPKDDHSLRYFDGTALYEHEDHDLAEHPDWGTLIFNYGRAEVKNFLLANALYWLEEFHIDGLRVDAVASMLYLDYSRKEGQWRPNRYGGRENLEAIDMLKSVNKAVLEECPGAFTIAEESTAWTGVTASVDDGGLGFTFKWNMGWMHDTLGYFQKEPVHRKYHQDQLTFAMLYENTERFINSISHDEVVHGKGALIDKMPGDLWQKFANLRLLLAYQYTRPGKQLVFMGTELAPHREWNHDDALDWALAHDPQRQALMRFLSRLGDLYARSPAFWRWDPDPASFEWIDCSDRDNSVLSYLRRSDSQEIVVVMNMTPVPRDEYRIGAPKRGSYVTLLSSDDGEFGGSDYSVHAKVDTENVPAHGRPQSMTLKLPPLAALIVTSE